MGVGNDLAKKSVVGSLSLSLSLSLDFHIMVSFCRGTA